MRAAAREKDQGQRIELSSFSLKKQRGTAAGARISNFPQNREFRVI
jgi:hypothetical protein